ncbi:hypothetical protein [Ralstonia phage RSL2]|uniref:Uncharacterized protein n=1 Tax=Ralstonia phage RSL2 TaxID=1585840 RepID=A0A146I563_9CAUD|nr:hypothetical protein [Ralstonia phage RSL2]
MTKQQFLAEANQSSNDKVKAKRKEMVLYIGFLLLVVVPLVAYMTDKLAK